MDQIKSLRDIPSALFFEFVIPDVTSHRRFGFTTTGGHYEITAGQSKERHSNGALTLVLLEYTCQGRRSHREEFLVFGYPVRLEDFREAELLLSPILTVRFSADDPPYCHNWNLRWEKGKGYWVLEHLDVAYGSSPNASTSLVSPNLKTGDWEFGFLLQVQKCAHALASEVPCRGHWQFEWNPQSSFLNNPQSS